MFIGFVLLYDACVLYIKIRYNLKWFLIYYKWSERHNMKNSDFYDFGEQIQKIVQSAIDSNDFKELNATVRQTVNDAVSAVRSGVSQASENMSKAQNKGETAGPQVHRGEVKRQSSYKQRDKEQAKYFASHPKGEIGGTLMVVIGFILSTMFGIGLAVLLIVQFVLDGLTALFIPIFILLLFFIIFMILGMRGYRITSRIKRFREYRKILMTRNFVTWKSWPGSLEKRRHMW